MDDGHFGAATQTASTFAQHLDRNIDAHDQDSLSVYGSLLLRGAVAAGQRNDRHTASTLLDEAQGAGTRLGGDYNYRWTAFGPTNVQLHRVNISLLLGDAGAAIHEARRIDLDRIPLTERKAALLIDTSRTLTQWGRHEKAYEILRVAHQLAPEEISARPAVHRVLRDLAATAPPSIRKTDQGVHHADRGASVTEPGQRRVLYVIVCDAGPAADVGKLVTLAHQQAWDVQIIATPSALDFIDTEALETQTGRPSAASTASPANPAPPRPTPSSSPPPRTTPSTNGPKASAIPTP